MIFLKIHINYDLMEQIDLANRGLRLQKIARFGFIYAIFNFTVISSFILLTLPDSKKLWFINLLATSIEFVGMTSFFAITMNRFKEVVKDNANKKLIKLTSQLSSLDIHTNVEMLKESKLVQTHHEIKLNNKKIPVLKQDKYIKIPVVNGMGKRFEETLYQEHIVGTRSYDLSIKKPDEKVQVKRNLAVQM